jgi:Choline dehydrogenase and related flavoproteins
MKRFKTLGRYFTLHPALTVYGIYPEKIKNYQGFPKTFYTDLFSETHGNYLETAFYYPFVTSKHLGLWGDELMYVMKRYDQLACILILNHDRALPSNRIKVSSSGDVIMCYTLSKESIRSLCYAQAQAARIFFSAGCEKVIMPCADKPVFGTNDLSGHTIEEFISEKNFISVKVPLSSAHPQGGCRMGVSPQDSVTNQWGQVHECQWLYVADASLFPMCSHVNPYLTIMALSDRVGEHLVDTKNHWFH